MEYSITLSEEEKLPKSDDFFSQWQFFIAKIIFTDD